MDEVKEEEEEDIGGGGGGESSNPTHNRKPHVTATVIASMRCIYIHVFMNGAS